MALLHFALVREEKSFVNLLLTFTNHVYAHETTTDCRIASEFIVDLVELEPIKEDVKEVHCFFSFIILRSFSC